MRKSKEPKGGQQGKGQKPLTALASLHPRPLISADLAAGSIWELDLLPLHAEAEQLSPVQIAGPEAGNC